MNTQSSVGTPPQNPFASSGLFTPRTTIWRPCKFAFEGWGKSGKSFTEALVALGIWIAEGEKSTIVLQDTEDAAVFYRQIFEPYGIVEGKNFFVTPSRSLMDFQDMAKLCEENRAILLLDSITHLYERMYKVWMEENEITEPQPYHSMSLKPLWKELFSDPFVRARCHILFTGRAAWEWDMEKNEQTNKKELVKTGVKMRGDNETAFEPDIVCLLERLQTVSKKKGVLVTRRLTILGDRSTLIDGMQYEFENQRLTPGVKADYKPVWKVFGPVFDVIARGSREATAAKEGSMSSALKTGTDRTWLRGRRQAEIFSEEIRGLFDSYLPGQGPKERKIKADIYFTVFDTRSATAIDNMAPERLREGKLGIEYLLHHINEQAEFIAKLQEDRGQSWDLAKYLADIYKAFRVSDQREQTDDIPIFDRQEQAPEEAAGKTEKKPAKSKAATKAGNGNAPEAEKFDPKLSALSLIKGATKENWAEIKATALKMVKEIKLSKDILDASNAINERQKEILK